jgi:hypothetical protein
MTVIAQRSDSYLARNTIVLQSLVGLCSLLAGGYIIYLANKWGSSLDLLWLDESGDTLFATTFFGSIGLLILVVYISNKQFQTALEPGEVFVASLYYALIAFVYSLVLYTIMSVLIPLLFGNAPLSQHFLFEALFLLFSFLFVGIAIGFIHALFLFIFNFDRQQHSILMSNETDVAACKMNRLSYRHQVIGFWRAFGFSSFTLLLALFTIMFILEGPIEDSNRISYILLVL